MKRFHGSLAAGAAILLAACSSGEDGRTPYVDVGYDGPTSTVPITSASSAGLLAADARDGLAGFGEMGSSATPMGAAAPDARASLGRALGLALDQLRSGVAAPTAATQSQTIACSVSGSMTATARIADPSGETLSSGDFLAVSFDRCVEGDPAYPEYQELMDGSMRINFTSVTDGGWFWDGMLPTAPGVLYEMQVVVTNFVTVDLATGYYAGLDGDMTVGVEYTAAGWMLSYITGDRYEVETGYDRQPISSAMLTNPPGASKYEAVSGEHLDEFGDADAYLSGFTARMCSTELGATGGCVNVITDPAFEIGAYDAYPYTGTMRLFDDAGRFIQVTALDALGAVSVTYDLDGDGGSPATGPITTTWDCLGGIGSSCPAL